MPVLVTFQLGLLVAADAELWNSVYELFKVDLAVSVRVEQVDDSLHQWILLQVVDLQEFFLGEGTWAVDVQLLEAFAQALNLLAVDFYC